MKAERFEGTGAVIVEGGVEWRKDWRRLGTPIQIPLRDEDQQLRIVGA